MGGAAHPGARPGRDAGRPLSRGLQPAGSLHLRDRPGAGCAHGTGAAGRGLDPRALLRRPLAPAEQPEHGGHPAADHEAGHRCSDDRLAPVLHELAPPVGDLADLRLEVVQRVLELPAGLLDGEPDLGGRAGGHQLRASSSARFVFCASSIASSGVGGVPFLIIRRPNSAAAAARSSSAPVVIPKPTQIFTLSQLTNPQESVSRAKMSINSAKNPASPNAAAPLAIRETFCVTSALASAISSRTRSCAFSVTSETISPSGFSAVPVGLIPSSLISRSLLQAAPGPWRPR